MRVVLDTNILVSGFLWDGPPNKIVQLLSEKKFTLVASAELFEELNRVSRYDRFARRLAALEHSPDDMVEKFETLAEFVPVRPLPQPVIPDDPSDEALLRAAVSGAASCIVTGDNHLLTLKIFQNTRIYNPVDFLQSFES